MPHASLDLITSLGQGNVCAFVGAGLSIGAGLPGWYDLIAELSARIGYKLAPQEWATGDALIDAAQAYVNRQGLHGLISHLKDRLDTTGVQPTAAHRALAQLPISLVFTANFDDLLERAFRDAGKRVEVVVRDSSIPFMRRGPGVVNIVKLYGDLDQPDTIVLARQQYESYFLQRPQMLKLLETELARSDMLYLGWSGSDPYFKLVFGELLSRFGQMMRPGYAVMFDVTDAQRDELARRQIRPVELPAGDRAASLAAWLDSLIPTSLPSATIPEFPMEFLFRGNWQTIRDLATNYLGQFASESIHNFELTYIFVDFIGSNHNDWANAISATFSYKGYIRTGKIGQIECHALGDAESLVCFRIESIAQEAARPFFVGLFQEAQRRGLVEPADAETSPAVQMGHEAPAVPTSSQPGIVANGAHSVAIDDNVSNSVIIIGDGNVVGDGSSSNVVKGQTPRKGYVRPGQAGPKWNTAAVRDLLNAAFNDEELTTLCFDTFRPVYDDFATGMSKGQKVQRLLDYCTRQEQVDDLLAAVRKANPKKYQQFEGQLKG